MTWLYWHRQFSLIAEYGTAYATISLLMIVCEWGGNSLLAREATDLGASDDHVTHIYSTLVATRLILATMVTAASVIAWFVMPMFETGFMAAGSLGLIAYAFSPAGLLDVRGRSGFSGVTQSLPVLALAWALPFCVDVASETSGLMLGAVFTVAHGVASVMQVAVTPRAWRPQLGMISAGAVYRTARLALPALLMQLPGQVLFRVQMYLGAAFLADAVLALFVYVRQIIGIGYAFVGFSTRVDMRDFAIAARRDDVDIMRLAISTFSARVALAITLAGTTIAGGLAFHATRPFAFIALYAPCVLMLAVSSNLQRSFLMCRREGPMLLVQVLTVVLTSALMLACIGTGQIAVLIGGEFASHVAQIVLLAVIWRQLPPYRGSHP